MKEGTLISPIPKEYLTYSDEEKLKKTEAYYQKIEDLYRRMDNSGGAYREKINALLHSEAASEVLFEVLLEKEAQILCLYQYDFFVLKMLCQIADKETVFGVPTILQNFHSLEEAVSWYQRCVFLLRRFEFGWEEDDELILLVSGNRVSYIYLAELICGEGVVRKVHTASKIAQYLYENGLMKDALLFLMYLEQKLPYSDRKIMVFAMTLLDWGERKLAYDILMKHQSPDRDIRKLQEELSDLIR